MTTVDVRENFADLIGASPSGAIGLPVLASSPNRVRPSRMSRWRALSLVIVHLLILGHIAHWLITGRTVSPIEPSEAMYTLNDGYVNAGFLFFAAALASTLIFGRFVCGWGCHLIAYQDLSAWLLGKLSVKPKPFRSRLLVFAPLALALYMFVWPSAYRWWVGAAPPPLTNHILKADFWETFPGPIVAIVTVLVCGFFAVYFLGGKGFCTYACPYGGFFRLIDNAATGKIRVTDACRHCGHCTAVCTSNVRVAEEVARFGMVVDPGCMKCMDCISVCPNDALYFGFGRPSITARDSGEKKKRTYDFTLWEECLAVGIGLAALLSYRGLYDEIPLLLAMGLGGIVAVLAIKSSRLLREANVRLQRWQLRRGGRLTRAGAVFASLMVAVGALTVHSAVVGYSAWRGDSLLKAADVGDGVWLADGRWWESASNVRRSRVREAAVHLARADQWGLMGTPSVLTNLVWAYLANGNDNRAEATVRRLIRLTSDRPDAYRGLAGVLRKNGNVIEAEVNYRKALSIDPHFDAARRDLAAMYVELKRNDELIELYRDAVEVDSQSGLAHYNLAMALLSTGQTALAIGHLEKAVNVTPTFQPAHYNLAVAKFMAGRPTDALPHIQEAIRLDPNDADAHGFLAEIRKALAQPGD